MDFYILVMIHSPTDLDYRLLEVVDIILYGGRWSARISALGLAVRLGHTTTLAL